MIVVHCGRGKVVTEPELYEFSPESTLSQRVGVWQMPSSAIPHGWNDGPNEAYRSDILVNEVDDGTVERSRMLSSTRSSRVSTHRPSQRAEETWFPDRAGGSEWRGVVCVA